MINFLIVAGIFIFQFTYYDINIFERTKKFDFSKGENS